MNLMPLYVMLGSIILGQLVGAVVTLIKWLGSRTVEQEDKDKAKFLESLEEHEKRFEQENQKFLELDRLVLTLQSDINRMREIVTTIRDSVAEIRNNIDIRLERQAQFYRDALKEHAVSLSEKLENLEFQLRQDTTRAIQDAQTYTRHKKP